MDQRLGDLLQAARRRLGVGAWSREYFERRFAQRDPWSYETSSYERAKYARTMEMIPWVAGARTLEVGCAEGVFTALLAQNGGEVLAVDICARALARAEKRCAELSTVTFARLDIASERIDGGFDVILCAEVLYYLHRRGLLRARDCLVAALKPGGHIALVNPVADAERIHPVFLLHPSLRVDKERTCSDCNRRYTITVFKKTS
ncbi:MAG TPA: SAM-dependent methyltransferase [Polyangiaceae bacterium]|jgi:2-polyprenyl-3-methyl-5-hydroxy-6-metoxy-1,4-benzoquinol methylase|nr:SAM-dependent methyltransferase [Polyangiaceae bacterium]